MQPVPGSGPGLVEVAQRLHVPPQLATAFRQNDVEAARSKSWIPVSFKHPTGHRAWAARGLIVARSAPARTTPAQASSAESSGGPIRADRFSNCTKLKQKSFPELRHRTSLKRRGVHERSQRASPVPPAPNVEASGPDQTPVPARWVPRSLARRPLAEHEAAANSARRWSGPSSIPDRRHPKAEPSEARRICAEP